MAPKRIRRPLLPWAPDRGLFAGGDRKRRWPSSQLKGGSGEESEGVSKEP